MSKVETIIKNIQNSYGDKYTDQDYDDFREFVKTQPKLNLVALVADLFDLDIRDAKDMVK